MALYFTQLYGLNWGSSMWCAGNYGTKVKKALELQAKGIPIEIIREADFYNALGIDDKSIK